MQSGCVLYSDNFFHFVLSVWKDRINSNLDEECHLKLRSGINSGRTFGYTNGSLHSFSWKSLVNRNTRWCEHSKTKVGRLIFLAWRWLIKPSPKHRQSCLTIHFTWFDLCFSLFADVRCLIRRSVNPLGAKDRGERVGCWYYHVQDGGIECRRTLLRSLQRSRSHPENGPRRGPQKSPTNFQQPRRRSRRDLQSFAR